MFIGFCLLQCIKQFSSFIPIISSKDIMFYGSFYIIPLLDDSFFDYLPYCVDNVLERFRIYAFYFEIDFLIPYAIFTPFSRMHSIRCFVYSLLFLKNQNSSFLADESMILAENKSVSFMTFLKSSLSFINQDLGLLSKIVFSSSTIS